MSASFFKTVANNPSSVASSFTGPDYQYAKFVRSPAKMGMGSSGGNLDADVAGIINYVRLLIEGGGPASATGQPLGDKFFITTGGQCDSDGSKVHRSIYIDNVPHGNIPFLDDIGMDMTMFDGMLPGILGDLGALNPVGLFGAFMQGATPPCSQVTLKTIDENNAHGIGTGFIVNSEIPEIDACNFENGTNSITGEKCTESFISANEALRNPHQTRPLTLKNNKMASVYTGAVGLLMVYIIYRLVYS
jgi:hypothetical protein